MSSSTRVARTGKGYKAYRRRARHLRNRTKSENLPCWLCGKAIDTELPAGDLMAFEADHFIPLKDGGKLDGEIRPSHKKCNISRNKAVPKVKPTATYR